MKFDKFPISEEIKKNLTDLGFFRTTDIQFKSIPAILRGEDVLAIAQTGTGKTAAFAIPIIDSIHSQKNSKRTLGIKCLVMVPTRELARQIGGVFNSISKHTHVKTFSLYGGVEQDTQIKKLQDGIDILIATPGRMFDLIKQGFVNIEFIDTLVLDEADHMLDLGFIKDIEDVKKQLKKRHQTLFFSATINPEIKKLAYSQVRSTALRIQISPDDPVSKNVSHFVMFIEMDDKRFFLEEYLNQNPKGKFIVFVRTRVRAERVVKAMARVNIQTLSIHGEKDQAERTEVMRAFREGVRNVLIATDITARGIDIPDVTHVINYDLPDKPENYVHRVGRTGRGFNKGLAVSFCSTEERLQLKAIQELLQKEIKVIKVDPEAYSVITEEVNPAENFASLIENEEARIKDFKRKKKKR